MSNFLLMAATLLEMKCKLLLPAVNDNENDEDPRQFLIEMLEEYKRYKKVAEMLSQIADEAPVYIYREKENNLYEMLKIDRNEEFDNLTLINLYNAFTDAMRTNKNRINNEDTEINYINKEIYNIKHKMDYICKLIEKKRRIKLSALFQDSRNKDEMAVIFQVVLLLIKENIVFVTQEKMFSDVMITGVLN